MNPKIYKGSSGIRFIVSTGIDLTDTTVTMILVKKPTSMKEVSWTAIVIDDPKDGVIEYTSVDGDLSEAGDYIVQSYIETDAGDKLYGEAVKFAVYNKFENNNLKLR